MKIRAIEKIGAILFLALFCVVVVLYGLSQLRNTEKGRNVNLLALVPADCVGVLETGNWEFLAKALSHAASSDELDSVCASVLSPFDDILFFSLEDAHVVRNHVGRLALSFHVSDVEGVVVAYLATSMSGKKLIGELLEEKGIGFMPKSVKYRGEEITVFPVSDGLFLSVYDRIGCVVVSSQKALIEKVIDAEKDGTSLQHDKLFDKVYQGKSADFLSLYAKAASFPLLGECKSDVWSEFDIHLSGKSFFVDGAMSMSEDDWEHSLVRLAGIEPMEGDSVLVLTDTVKIDSCITRRALEASHTLFDKCVQDLSPDALYVCVVDMDEVINHPDLYKPLLPAFVYEHRLLFRPFILSLQITRSKGKLSHLFVFAYKE